MLPVLFVFLIGLTIGSFLNVLILRTREEVTISGRSQCLSCKVTLGPGELVPVVSYILLKGRCKHCGTSISQQYPLVEFATGLLFVLFYLRYAFGLWLPEGFTVALMPWFLLRDLAFTAVLVVLFVYDFRYYLILDRFTVPAMVFAFVVNILLGMNPLSLLTAAAVLGGFFFLQYILSRGSWIGGGDIRMGILMGLMLGLKLGLAALFVAYFLGAVVGAFMLLSKRLELKSEVPFGAFLAFATILMLLAGEGIVGWYLGLVGSPGDLSDFLRTS